MKKLLLNLSVPVLLISGAILIITSTVEAKYQPSPAVAEMSKDIKAAQEFVREYETQVLKAKQKAEVYRKAICEAEKEACTKEYLDPANSGVDLSSFLAPAAK